MKLKVDIDIFDVRLTLKPVKLPLNICFRLVSLGGLKNINDSTPFILKIARHLNDEETLRLL